MGFGPFFGHLIEFGLVAQLSKQPQNGFYKVNQDMGRKFKTARVGTPLHGIGSVKSTVLIRENPQFMWPACDFFIFGYKLAIFGHLSSTINDDLATQVSLGRLKMVPMSFRAPAPRRGWL